MMQENSCDSGVNIISDKKAINSYANGWLRYMSQWSGLDKEDVELVSVCDINDLGLLLKPKTRPIRIVGGPEVFNDKFYMMFADALCVGEGFEFFKDFKRFGSLKKVLERPYMLTPDKDEVTASDHIDWSLAPAIKTNKRKIMMLGGRGCKNKCKFCFTSWTTKHQNAPALHVPAEAKGMIVNVISNDHSGEDDLSQKVAVRSITVKSYLAMTREQAANCRYYRFGLESFTEKGRRFFNKPIKNSDLKALLAIAKTLGHDIQLFVIAGIEPQESILEFLDAVGKDVAKKPRIFIKGTYFNPCLHTPLADFDISKLHSWNIDWIYGKLTEHSGRYRTTMAHDAGNGIYRGLIRRAENLEQVKLLWPCRNKKRGEIEQIVADNSLEHLYRQVPETRVKFSWRKA